MIETHVKLPDDAAAGKRSARRLFFPRNDSPSQKEVRGECGGRTKWVRARCDNLGYYPWQGATFVAILAVCKTRNRIT